MNTTFTIGGDLTVNRLGFGAMRITGQDRRGVVSVSERPCDRDEGGFDRPGPGKWVENARPERLREGLDGSLKESEQFDALRGFQREGKIRHVGLSEINVEQIERARKYFEVATVQNRYNQADREWEPVLEYCEKNDIGFIPWYPLNVGKLAGDAASALAWLLNRSPVILPIPGTSKVKHLEENMQAR